MAFEMRIKFGSNGAAIDGLSTDPEHPDDVPIVSWSWGASTSVDPCEVTLRGEPARVGRICAAVQDISITRAVDS